MSLSRRSAAIFLTGLGLLWWSPPAGASVFETAARDDSYPVTRQVRYRFLVENKTNMPIREAGLLVSAPVRQTPTQQCLRIESSHPCELSSDGQGNQFLRYRFEELPPFARKIITIRADLALAEAPRPGGIGEEESSSYLGPEHTIESEHPEILGVAATLKGPTAAQTVERTFRWVSGTLHYSGYTRDNRGALAALRMKEGDCTEYMSLFVALCRAIGIPARGMAGYVTEGSAFFRPEDYHNWAEVYVDGGWQVVDPQGAVIFPERPGYVAMAVLGGPGSELEAGAPRLRTFGDGVDVKMER